MQSSCKWFTLFLGLPFAIEDCNLTHMVAGGEHGRLILTRVWYQNGDCERMVSVYFLLHIVPFFQVAPSRLRASAHSVVRKPLIFIPL